MMWFILFNSTHYSSLACHEQFKAILRLTFKVFLSISGESIQNIRVSVALRSISDIWQSFGNLQSMYNWMPISGTVS